MVPRSRGSAASVLASLAALRRGSIATVAGVLIFAATGWLSAGALVAAGGKNAVAKGRIGEDDMEDHHENEPPDDCQAHIGVARDLHVEEIALRADRQDAPVEEVEIANFHDVAAAGTGVVGKDGDQPDDRH